MEELLIDFINTLDSSLKNFQKQIGNGSEFSKLTINQYHYIDAIHDLGEPTITQIAVELNITKASVTAGIKKLAVLGLVRKTQSSADRRVFHVNLTVIGEKLITAKYKALKEYGEFICAALSDVEARQFMKIISKLVKFIEQA
jgi:DNA-binding MarR family transcriptional regulator